MYIMYYDYVIKRYQLLHGALQCIKLGFASLFSLKSPLKKEMDSIWNEQSRVIKLG